MGFDINEARAIVEEARKRGLIRGAEPKKAEQAPAGAEAEIGHLPDWLQKGIREPESREEEAGS